MTPPAAHVERFPGDVGHMGPAERLVCPRTSGWLLRCLGQTLICPRSSDRCSAAGSMLGLGRRIRGPDTLRQAGLGMVGATGLEPTQALAFVLVRARSGPIASALGVTLGVRDDPASGEGSKPKVYRGRLPTRGCGEGSLGCRLASRGRRVPSGAIDPHAATSDSTWVLSGEGPVS